jgi:YVTN family beta-propeller protein
VEYRILGPLEVMEGNRAVPIGGGRQRALLALLLLHANEVVTRERLIDALWPDRPPESADKIVQNHVSALRKLLPAGAVLTRGRGYELSLRAGELDLNRFHATFDEGRRLLADGAPAEASARLGDALSLWRGEPLADCLLDSSAKAESAALGELRLSALEYRLSADLAAGRHASVVGELESLVAANPYRERFREHLMRALYLSGRPADALAAYREAHRVFREDLGLEPGSSLRDLENAILTQDPALDPPAPAVGARAPGDAFGRDRPRLLVGAALLGGLIAAAALIPILVLGRSSKGSIVTGPNALAVIDPSSNKVVAPVPVGVRPGAVAIGAGAVWVTNLDDQTLSRIDPKTRVLVRTISLDAAPTGLAVGPNAVWVANGLSGTVSRVDPGVDAVAETVGGGSRSFIGSIAVGEGSIWAVFGAGTVLRIDPTRSSTTASGLAGFAPSAVATGEGAVWVANAGGNTVSRLDPHTVRAVESVSVGSRPSAVAVGGGSVWVASQGDDLVTRIDPATNSVAETIRVGRRPEAVAFGGGAVWVASSAGTVSRIDPSTGDVVKVIEVGSRPAAIAFGAGRVWVALQRPA